ncbi:antibiotic biosynthesis monooxygenase family protein [Patiriisocius marinus]|uniref:Polysaccharide biosynthesis protein n=1 Tax=Patiriisocius marinus TaxID=1397112 RepID=A0A5J4IUW1_9FLAO|nr:antibiotic biosynthesis monooxygenase [Patiriisocius marinus]GER58546.1 polysaccharide biosynthesis protein [Patiriisocius marinus]
MVSKHYFAVIFTSTLIDNPIGYHEMALKMEELARQQHGFIDISSARNETGITVSYWETEQAILNWKANIDHQLAQKLGKSTWYASYKVEIARVERSYVFSK